MAEGLFGRGLRKTREKAAGLTGNSSRTNLDGYANLDNDTTARTDTGEYASLKSPNDLEGTEQIVPWSDNPPYIRSSYTPTKPAQERHSSKDNSKGLLRFLVRKDDKEGNIRQERIRPLVKSEQVEKDDVGPFVDPEAEKAEGGQGVSKSAEPGKTDFGGKDAWRIKEKQKVDDGYKEPTEDTASRQMKTALELAGFKTKSPSTSSTGSDRMSVKTGRANENEVESVKTIQARQNYTTTARFGMLNRKWDPTRGTKTTAKQGKGSAKEKADSHDLKLSKSDKRARKQALAILSLYSVGGEVGSAVPVDNPTVPPEDTRVASLSKTDEEKVQVSTKVLTSKDVKILKASLEEPKQALKILTQLRQISFAASTTSREAGKDEVQIKAHHTGVGRVHIREACLDCVDREAALRLGQKIEAASTTINAAALLAETSQASVINTSKEKPPRPPRHPERVPSSGSPFGDDKEEKPTINALNRDQAFTLSPSTSSTETTKGTEFLTSKYKAVEAVSNVGAVPTPGKVIGQVLTSTGAFNTLAGLSGRLVDYSGVHDGLVIQPPKDRMSVLVYWWGYEIVFPPPSLAYLAGVNSVASTTFTFLQAVAVTGGAPELAPFIRYLSMYIDMEWKAIHGQDKGKGVVLAATWVVPVAVVPRPYDFK